jgi:Fe-S oxidoreductase
MLKIAPQRNFPVLSRKTFWKWAKKHKSPDNQKQIYVFNDEFTNYIDSEIGIYTVLFLEKLGYSIKILPPMKSGRTYISKGLEKEHKKWLKKIFVTFLLLFLLIPLL